MIVFMGHSGEVQIFKAEVADIHIRRAIIKIMSRHHQFCFPNITVGNFDELLKVFSPVVLLLVEVG